MVNIMDILHITDKGEIMNTLERFQFYNETKTANRTNDKCTVRPNTIFNTLILRYTNKGQSTPQLPLPIVTSLSRTLRHSQHASLRLTSQLHNKS